MAAPAPRNLEIRVEIVGTDNVFTRCSEPQTGLLRLNLNLSTAVGGVSASVPVHAETWHRLISESVEPGWLPSDSLGWTVMAKPECPPSDWPSWTLTVKPGQRQTGFVRLALIFCWPHNPDVEKKPDTPGETLKACLSDCTQEQIESELARLSRHAVRPLSAQVVCVGSSESLPICRAILRATPDGKVDALWTPEHLWPKP